MSPTIDMFNLGGHVGPKPMDQAIDEAFASFGVPKLGGASADGWSKMSDYQRCPYRYWALHEQAVTTENSPLVQLGPKPLAFELGGLFHALLACHYIGSVEGVPEYPTALALLNRLGTLGCDASILQEAERLYMAYWERYGNPHDEGFEPVAVELQAGTSGTHTCRFDLLAKRNGGTWIVEHKTSSREDRNTLESWWLDGEILGEVYGYKLSGLEKTFGPLVGVLVNVVIKTQVPKFRRIEVVIPDGLVQRYADERQYWGVQRRQMKLDGIWPRKLQGCIGRYDTCSLWDHCRDAEATDSYRLTKLLEASLEIPKGSR